MLFDIYMENSLQNTTKRHYNEKNNNKYLKTTSFHLKFSLSVTV